MTLSGPVSPSVPLIRVGNGRNATSYEDFGRMAVGIMDTLERVTQRAELAEADRAEFVSSFVVKLQESMIAYDVLCTRAAKLEGEVDWLARRATFLEAHATALEADNRRLRRARIHDGALIREAIAKLIADGKADPQPFEEGAADMLREDQEPPEEAPETE